jgi:hypothetical protein
MSHSPSPPTRREIVLVLALLLAILYYSNSHVDTRLVPAPISPPLHPSVQVNTALQEKTPHVYDTRLTWGNNQVPQSKVLSNVPGNFSKFTASGADLTLSGQVGL